MYSIENDQSFQRNILPSFLALKNKTSKEPLRSKQEAELELVLCFVYSSTLKMEAACFSETSVYFQQARWRYVPEYRTARKVMCLTFVLKMNIQQFLLLLFLLLFGLVIDFK
jgi:hypothetical protein